MLFTGLAGCSPGVKVEWHPIIPPDLQKYKLRYQKGVRGQTVRLRQENRRTIETLKA